MEHIERSFGRGTTRFLGDLLTMVINHLLNGMILQAWNLFETKAGQTLTSALLRFHANLVPVKWYCTITYPD